MDREAFSKAPRLQMSDFTRVGCLETAGCAMYQRL